MIEKVTEERIRVRYGETDQMGHAYYANYFFWFEQARGAWCRDRGFTYREMEAGGHLLPVVEAHAEYKGEVHYDDWMVVKVWVSELRRASIRFEYEIVNESSGKVTTKGHTWHVLMGQRRKAITIPDSVKELFHRDPDDYERLS